MFIDALCLDFSFESTELWFCFSIILHHKVQWKLKTYRLLVSLDTGGIFQSSGDLCVLGWGAAQDKVLV